jgi:hypothetical protein
MYTLDKEGIKREKSKKALSIMIGYVLLIVFAIVIGVLVYAWMKTYVPVEDLVCDEGSSLSIYSYTYDSDTAILTLELKNNGQFDIGGYYIYATDSPERQLANIDLSIRNSDPNPDLLINPGMKFNGYTEENPNSLAPGKTETETFILTEVGQIYSLEIVPIRFQTEKRKTNQVSCTDSRITLDVSYSEDCVSDPNVCSGRVCGEIMDNCYNYVSCGPPCGLGEICDSTGQCVVPANCAFTCDGRECGRACGVNCGTSSGNCESGFICNLETGQCEICPPESNDEFCEGRCGVVTKPDNCGDERTVDCDVCSPISHTYFGCSAEGYCEVTGCDPGWDNCDTLDETGCETQLGRDSHCASCLDVCTLPETCINGACDCIHEDDDTFCLRLLKNCGTVTDVDNCLIPRTVESCGVCILPEVCSGGGIPNVCGESGGGGIYCINYCLAAGKGYQSSDCFKNKGQCGISRGGTGHSESGGNDECGGINCCCYHEPY